MSKKEWDLGFWPSDSNITVLRLKKRMRLRKEKIRLEKRELGGKAWPGEGMPEGRTPSMVNLAAIVEKGHSTKTKGEKALLAVTTWDNDQLGINTGSSEAFAYSEEEKSLKRLSGESRVSRAKSDTSINYATQAESDKEGSANTNYTYRISISQQPASHIYKDTSFKKKESNIKSAFKSCFPFFFRKRGPR
jgi:hypothetical protein